MDINVASADILARLLHRQKRRKNHRTEVDLGIILKEILSWANKLVPSESGSILIDDPVAKLTPGKERRLYFAACFGKGSDSLTGTFLTSKWGIARETYRTGKPYISREASKDSKFYSKIDKKISYRTVSIICAPVRLNNAAIGVIELINRKRRMNYNKDELALLEIFAGYTATLINNALLARDFEELSRRDDLSGLYNDRHFFSTLEKEIGNALQDNTDLSLIFFDLDRFKEINDTYGHLAGSRVLKEMGDLLRKIFHNTNAVMSRYGGDEYVIILPDADINEAGRYAEKIRAAIEGNTFLRTRLSAGEHPLNIKGVVTASIGVASLLRNIAPAKNTGEMVEALIKAADNAMYEAKEQGKNMVCRAKGRKT